MPHITNQQHQWFHSNVSCSPSFPLLYSPLTLPIGVSLSHPSHFSHFTHSLTLSIPLAVWSFNGAHPFVLVPLLFLFCSFGSVCIFSLSLQWATIECICYATVKIRLTCADDYRLRGYFFSLSLPLLQFDCYEYRFWVFSTLFFLFCCVCVCLVLYVSFVLFLLFRICIGQNREPIHPKIVSLHGFLVFFLVCCCYYCCCFFAILFFFSFTVYFVPAVCLYLRHTVH